MKIIEITSQNRRDFYADYKCEHCGHIEKNKWGYDDDHFHKNVIPNMRCKKCDKTSSDNYRALTTKYPKDQIV